MFEAFAINVASAIFYDATKKLLHWHPSQLAALRAAYKQAFTSASELYIQVHGASDTELLQQAFVSLLKVDGARHWLLDLALGSQAQLAQEELKQLCIKQQLNETLLMPFIGVFQAELRREIRVIGEEPESPLFNLANSYEHERQEKKMDDIAADVKYLKEIIGSGFVPKDQFYKLQAILSDEIRQRLDEIRQDWNKGYTEDVLATLQQFRANDEKWLAISGDVQAQLLRTEVSFLLEIGSDIETATRLLEQAKKLSPDNDADSYLRAFIGVVEKDFVTALDNLADLRGEQALHLKAIILIEMGCFEDAQTILDGFGIPTNIHICYTQARLALRKSDVETAIKAIEAAVRLAPDSEDMQFWLAQLKYFSALSPVIHPPTFQTLPEPVNPIFYRDMPLYRRRLEEATNTLRHLTTTSKPNLRYAAEVWYLACLLNNLSTSTEQALTYVQYLIRENPRLDFAIAWAMMRRLNLDYESAIELLKQKIVTGTANVGSVTTLVSYFLQQENFQAAGDLLFNTRHIFQDEEEGIWHDWLIQVHIASKKFDLAEEGLAHMPNEAIKRQLKFSILANKQDDNEMAKFLKGDFTDDPILLLSICDFTSRHNDWTWACQHAETLIQKVDTRFAFSLAIEALYREAENSRCLAAIDKISERLHPDPLPWTYQNAQVRCLLARGHFKQAYIQAKALYESSPNTDTFVTLSGVFEYIGDLESIAIIARDLITKPINLYPMDVLKITQITSLSNLNLAIELWRKVMQSEMPDEAVLFALLLANTLGTKAETEVLFHRMSAMAQRGDSAVKLLTFKDGAEMLRERYESNKLIHTAHQKAEAPVHMTTAMTGTSLIWLYHHRLKLVEDIGALDSQTALGIRHGGRPIFQGFIFDDFKGHLALDITSILLQEHFELLGIVEEAFAPIRIPHGLVLALSEMLLDYHAADRENIEACKQIVELAEQPQSRFKLINLPVLEKKDSALKDDFGAEWVAQYRYTEQNQGYFVNFLPVLKHGLELEPGLLPENAEHFLIDTRSIVDSLLDYRAITRKEYDRVIQALGSTSQSGTSLRPRQGAKLVFFANTLEHIAGQNLLRKIAQVFEIVITEQQLEDAKRVVRGESQIHLIVDWLSTLINKLFRNIMADKYIILPDDTIKSGHDEAINSRDHLSMSPLYSLLGQYNQPGNIVISDDRYVNGVDQNNQARIFTSVDVLRALVEAKVVNPEDYYEILTRFRRANLRSIPYSSDEIMYHLFRNLNFDTLIISPSHHLDTMREYLKACLSQIEILQLVPSKTALNKEGEKRFLADTCFNIFDAIASTWDLYFNSAVPAILSKWLLDNLYVPNRNIFLEHDILNLPDNSDMPFPELLIIAENLSERPDQGGYSKQERYRMWLWFWRGWETVAECDKGTAHML